MADDESLESDEKKDFNLKDIKKDLETLEDVESFVEDDSFNSIASAISDGIHILDNEDGTTTSVTYKNGKKNGPCQVMQGEKILMEMIFTEDVLAGMFKFYLPNQIVQTIMTYVNGKLHGEFIQYYSDGKSIQLKTVYENGLQQGLSQSFDQQGNLVQDMMFKDGNLDGPMNTYHNNELIARTFYKDGAEVMQAKH